MIYYHGADVLKSLGLGQAFVVLGPDHTPTPLVGLHAPEGAKIVEYTLSHLPEGVVLYADYDCMIRNIPIRSH